MLWSEYLGTKDLGHLTGGAFNQNEDLNRWELFNSLASCLMKWCERCL